MKITKANNSVLLKDSRYTQGGLTEFYPNRVSWWERKTFEPHATDLFYDVTASTEFRPDLISHQIYQNAKYFWLVLQYNNIVDINEELVVGKVLRLPTPNRLVGTLLNSSRGGKRVTDV